MAIYISCLVGVWVPKANFVPDVWDCCWIKCIPRSSQPLADLGWIFVYFCKFPVNCPCKRVGFLSTFVHLF